MNKPLFTDDEQLKNISFGEKNIMKEANRRYAEREKAIFDLIEERMIELDKEIEQEYRMREKMHNDLDVRDAKIRNLKTARQELKNLKDRLTQSHHRLIPDVTGASLDRPSPTLNYEDNQSHHNSSYNETDKNKSNPDSLINSPEVKP
jgi:hypothetical protein